MCGYYGNHVFGDGEASPVYEREDRPQLEECSLCFDSFNQGETHYLESIDSHVCTDCINQNPTYLLEWLHRMAGINPQDNAHKCLKLNKELISKGLLNLPVFRYMQGLDYGMRYNLPLLKRIIKL